MSTWPESSLPRSANVPSESVLVPPSAFLLTCIERWGQIYILDSLLSFVPQSHMEAEQLAERISVRLQHANSAVVLTTIKVILYLMNYMEDEGLIMALERKMGPPLGEL